MKEIQINGLSALTGSGATPNSIVTNYPEGTTCDGDTIYRTNPTQIDGTAGGNSDCQFRSINQNLGGLASPSTTKSSVYTFNGLVKGRF